MPTIAADLKSLYSDAAKSAPERRWNLPAEPARFNFEAGLPDPATFPVEELLELSARVLRREADQALQYGAGGGGIAYGFEGLRDRLAVRLGDKDGRQIDRSGVILTSGGAQGISLSCGAFLNTGDVAAVEAPTWGYALRDIRLHGAEPLAIPLDADGMCLDVLEEHLGRLRREGRRLKLVYTIATFNTPTGICMSLERRQRLVRLAQDWGFVILEDNTYGDLRYDGDALPSLFSLDDSGLVLKLDSFSKTVVPGIRLGWVGGKPEAVAALAAVRRDLGVSQWLARLMAEYLGEDRLESHIHQVNALYRRKRDAAVAAIEQHCSPWVSFRIPDGGFFLWLEIAAGVNGARLQERALAEGVVCRPGESFFGDEGGGQFLRLAFSMVPIEEVSRGVEVLGRAFAESASEAR